MNTSQTGAAVNASASPLQILRLDSSARYAESASRQLTDQMVARLLRDYPEAKVITRDLAVGLPLPTEPMVDGILYAMQNPTPSMQVAKKLSDEMAAELLAADVVVLGLPIYNWTIPSTFKAYVDHISRPGVTFEYVDGVSRGKLKAKSVYILFTSGGTSIGSFKDFATPYLKYLWQTLGIQQVHFIEASELLFNAAECIQKAEGQINQLEIPAFS